MALLHRAKVTHSLTPSRSHLSSFFASVAKCRERGKLVDVILVDANGEITHAHALILASSSVYVRDLLQSIGKDNQPLTIMLPDFASNTIRSLVNLLYTGKSLPNTRSMGELRQLLRLLKIDLGDAAELIQVDKRDKESNQTKGSNALTSSSPKTTTTTIAPSTNSSVSESTSTTTAPEIPTTSEKSGETSNSETTMVTTTSTSPTKTSSSSTDPVEIEKSDMDTPTEPESESGMETTEALEGSLEKSVEESEDLEELTDERNEGEDQESSAVNDEMLEVTPEVNMFFGNHFLANHENANEGNDEDDEEEECGVKEANATTIAQVKKEAQLDNLDKANSNVTATSTSFSSPLEATASSSTLNLSSNMRDHPFKCRLCGKVSGNAASLFAHMLYPHYAHLWRHEIPHRAQRYDCRQCSYNTTKRQHFIMHVARVHDELRKKLAALGENLEVLDNLTQKAASPNFPLNTERIVSRIAKGIGGRGELTSSMIDEMAMNSSLIGNQDDNDGLEKSFSEEIGNSSNHNSASQPNNMAINNNMARISSMLANNLFPWSTSTSSTSSTPTTTPMETSNGPTGGRYPRGFKPFVRCRLCGKSWKGKDNFFTHLVSTHFKYLWANEVPRSADMYHCHVPGCSYQSKYRYNFLFHLAGKHKQLKQKLAQEGIPENVLTPIETEDPGQPEGSNGGNSEVNTSMMDAAMAAALNANGNQGGSVAAAAAMAMAAAAANAADGRPMLNPSEILRHSHMLMAAAAASNNRPNVSNANSTPTSNSNQSNGSSSSSSSSNNTRLICRVCSKVSLNHTCHRQHVVGKHFYEFWSHLSPDAMGIFNCHHPNCPYKTPNRSVFIIHLAYVHHELKNKLIQSGRDPNCVIPDVFGKRKYRRNLYDNTQHHFDHATLAALAAQANMAGGGDSSNSHMLSGNNENTSSMGGNESADEGVNNESNDETASTAMTNSGIPTTTADSCTRCRVCGTEFPHYSAVVKHLALSHFGHVWEEPNVAGPFFVPASSGASGTFTCPHCPFNSISRAAFICHLVGQHDALKQILSLQFGGGEGRTLEDLVEMAAAQDDNDEQQQSEHDEQQDEREVYRQNLAAAAAAHAAAAAAHANGNNGVVGNNVVDMTAVNAGW